MKGRKRRFFIIFLIILLAILLIFAIHMFRNTLILSSIDKMVTNLENNNQNIYARITTTDINGNITSTEHFLKDNIYKEVTKVDSPSTDNVDLLITTYIYPSSKKVFTEMENTRSLVIKDDLQSQVRGYHIDNATYAIIMNLGFNEDFSTKALASMSSIIRSVKVDNKDYYLIKNFINSGYMYDADAKEIMAYVEKDTGLPFKIVEIFEENGTTLEKISLFEYKFDCVTDSDMVEPDETMFSIQEE